MSDHDEGLITQYVDKIRALGIRAEAGEPVTASVDKIVSQAIEHFRIVKSSSPKANLSAFKGRLAITADVVHSSQPEFKRTLQYAADTCPVEL